ncbi:MAG TPA: S9 family peptidase [Terracidiphilus sp.]|nr:S9 family peptidase [Terracidiphilus sp.]
MSRVHSLAQVALSPDGKRLAWIQDGEILVAPLENIEKSQHVTAGAGDVDWRGCTEHDLAWSPDSTALAFLSDCGTSSHSDLQDDLFLTRLDGHPAHRLTILHGYADAPAFSPDGSRIAFLYVEGATRPAGALAAMTPPSGVIGEEGVEIQRIAVAQTNAATPAQPALVSSADLHVYEFDWSPDSKLLAYIAADPPGENNWWLAKLYTQRFPDVIGATAFSSSLRGGLGMEPKAILAPAEIGGPLHGLQIAVPRWSPNGKSIAFIGGLMSDQGVTGGDLYEISASGGEPKRLTDDGSSVAWFHWNGDNSIATTEIHNGSVYLTSTRDDSVDASGTAERNGEKFDATIGTGELMFSQSLARDGTEAFILSSFSKPPEIWIDRGGKARPLTHLNDAVEPVWGKAVSVEWTSDKFHVQGWLMVPKGYDPAKKYPMIVEVHGGPASAVVPHWGTGGALSSEVFSALGYFMFLPNPRGSFGQGEAFTEANRKDFGYGDLRDILAGIDAVEAKYSIDPNRIGLDGWSYGGFMTMFAVTQTHRFKAAVAGAGISDWLSYYGENSIDQWMIPYFGTSVYDDPAVYARSSAINFIKQASTPTLLVVGDRDGECPAPQSFEFWHGLRDLHVPTELVVYPDEGHGFTSAAHRRDVLERAAAWFARFMPSGS